MLHRIYRLSVRVLRRLVLDIVELINEAKEYSLAHVKTAAIVTVTVANKISWPVTLPVLNLMGRFGISYVYDIQYVYAYMSIDWEI